MVLSSVIFAVLFATRLVLADDFRIFCCIRNVENCKLLQSDIDSMHKWCLNNGMNLTVGITTCISFTYKTNSIAFRYKLDHTHISYFLCAKYLGVLVDSKLHFYSHVGLIVTQALKMLCLILLHYIFFFFFHWLPCCLVLCCFPILNLNLPLTTVLLWVVFIFTMQ